MSDLVGNAEDRFTRVADPMMLMIKIEYIDVYRLAETSHLFKEIEQVSNDQEVTRSELKSKPKKTKLTITAQLICGFVFANTNCWFSHAMAHIQMACLGSGGREGSQKAQILTNGIRRGFSSRNCGMAHNMVSALKGSHFLRLHS